MPPRPSLGSPPSHLPRPPGREWTDDQPSKRARRDGSAADEEKPSDNVIRERIKRERPCRTLFVRNIEFNADIEDLRRRFEAFGEVKSWFDLTSKRGLLFISYFDLRQAEYAKDAMQEFEVNGRRMDVHYSLPREIDMTKRCDREKDQGTLFILLKRAQGELNDDEVRSLFAQYGEIKSLRRYKDQGNCRFIEYYDCRACKAAHDALLDTAWNGGSWDLKFAWDAATPDRIAEKPKREREQLPPPMRQPEYGGARPPLPPSPSPGGPPRWGGSEQSYGPPPSAYPAYGSNPPGTDFSRPPQPPSSMGPAPNASYGTKRPFDYDDRAGPEPPMRRWGQAQGSPVATSTGQYGPPRPPGQTSGGGYGGQYGGQQQHQDASYARYGGERNEYGAAPPPLPPQQQQQQPQQQQQQYPIAAQPPNRWGGAPNAPHSASSSSSASGYGPPPPSHHQNIPPIRPLPPSSNLQRPPPPPQLQHQQQQQQQQQQQHQQTPAAPVANDDRLEQAQKVQQLLASLKPGGAMAVKAPTISSPVPTPAVNNSSAPASAPAPSLPSNIAALLQMAQNNAAKK
ncbi:hypothetical protein CBS101457_002383 [Exobasidium rhododendri]|nr:hypothetical protein CBS101457_002383 [Exobasidium rhododendri]